MPNRRFDAFPEQAAAIPIRRAGRTLQICVIRRKDANRWGIPKGLVDPGDTHEETALNEAWEEAGINGRLLGAAIGTYRYRKWGTRLTVAVYVMEVLEQAKAGKSRRSASGAGCPSRKPESSWPTIRSRRSSTGRTPWSRRAAPARLEV